MVLEGAPEVNDIRHLTTLAGWVHARLTGRHVVGLCEASGIFPVDPETRTYDARMSELFDAKIAALGRDVPWKVADILPQALSVGCDAGRLTPEGARLLERMDVYILPMANLDGYLANKRVSGDGYDLNRDQTKFADPWRSCIVTTARPTWMRGCVSSARWLRRRAGAGRVCTNGCSTWPLKA